MTASLRIYKVSEPDGVLNHVYQYRWNTHVD
jgi:hypothetical protein